MTGHLKMLQSPSAMNNAEGVASRFPAQASKFICTPSSPPPLTPTRAVSCGAEEREQSDADLVTLNSKWSGQFHPLFVIVFVFFEEK